MRHRFKGSSPRAIGPDSGSSASRGVYDLPVVELVASRSARIDGFSLHANTELPSGDRDRLERVSRYMMRPAVAYDRFGLRPDGKISYELKRMWSDGTTHVVFEPGELIEKLAALVPFPQKTSSATMVFSLPTLTGAGTWFQPRPSRCRH